MKELNSIKGRKPEKKEPAPVEIMEWNRQKEIIFNFWIQTIFLNLTSLKQQLALLRKSKPLSVATSKWGSFRVSTYLNVKQKWNSYGKFKPAIKLLQTFGKYNEYFPPIVYLNSERGY